MMNYRCYFLGVDGHIRDYIAITAHSDREAIEHAQKSWVQSSMTDSICGSSAASSTASRPAEARAGERQQATFAREFAQTSAARAVAKST